MCAALIDQVVERCMATCGSSALRTRCLDCLMMCVLLGEWKDGRELKNEVLLIQCLSQLHSKKCENLKKSR